MNDKKKQSANFKLILVYLITGSLFWGIYILPLLGKYLTFINSVPIIVSIIIAFVCSSLPIYNGFHIPKKGKEIYILLYPVITVPVLFIGTFFKSLLFK